MSFLTNLQSNKKQLIPYYVLSAGFNAARMGIGATAVIYMMSKGISLAEIATIKMFQGGIVFFAEIPTGLISDRFGRKLSVLLACLCSIISFLLFVSLDNFWGFALAEVFNGLCLAFFSGSFEAMVVDENKDLATGDSSYFEKLFASIASYSALATMFGGLFGGLVGEFHLLYPFALAFSLMLAVMVYTQVFVKENFIKPESESKKINSSLILRTHQQALKISKLFHGAIKTSLESKDLRMLFIIQILLQFAMQPLLHYWQPYFQGLSSDVSTSFLGWLFFLYVAGQFVASSLTVKFLDRSLITIEQINVFTNLLLILTTGALFITQNYILASVAYVFAQSLLIVLRNNLNANANRFIASEERASVLSIVSFISRIGMLLSLLIIQQLTKHTSVSSVYMISFLSFATMLFFMLKWNLILRFNR